MWTQAAGPLVRTGSHRGLMIEGRDRAWMLARGRVVAAIGIAALIAGASTAARAVDISVSIPREVSSDPHADIFAESSYPTAAQCGVCHQQVYSEWAISNHAYSSISPMFHKFEQRINDLSQGTIGYFCMRCHASVGTTLKESRDLPLWERAQVSREGVTCVSCHRVSEQYGKVNADRRIEPGRVYEPVYGPIGGEGVAEVVRNKEEYKVIKGGAWCDTWEFLQLDSILYASPKEKNDILGFRCCVIP